MAEETDVHYGKEKVKLYGYDGAAWQPVKVNASGELQCVLA